MEIDKNKFIVAINRAIEFGAMHEAVARQTSNQKKSDAHKAAARDLFKLADEMAAACSQSAFVKTPKAYKAAINNQIS